MTPTGWGLLKRPYNQEPARQPLNPRHSNQILLFHEPFCSGLHTAVKLDENGPPGFSLKNKQSQGTTRSGITVAL